jgi:pimeloyl-ACP methyl ester carboxylesterase
MNFRQDSIVADAELIRGELTGGRPWTALGQSFGGFCVTRYLSAAPVGLEAAIITGGLPPLELHPDEIYRATYRRVLEKNRRYFARYPRDAALAREIVEILGTRDVRLQSGGRLSPRRFQQLGIAFGASDGFERVHYLLESAFVDGRTGRELSTPFLRGFESAFAFDTNPIYALLHEAEYCQGSASRWSAQRIRAEYPEFDRSSDRPGTPSKDPSKDGPVLFTGEMVYPWMFQEYTALAPMAGAADILAEHEAWPRLYDAAVLGRNTVPVVASVYYDDMYVEREFSEQTASAIRGLRLWVTNEFEHNALRARGEGLLDRLLSMLRGRA